MIQTRSIRKILWETQKLTTGVEIGISGAKLMGLESKSKVVVSGRGI